MKKGKERKPSRESHVSAKNFPPSPNPPFSPTGRDLYGGSPPQPLPSKKRLFFCPPPPVLKPPREGGRNAVTKAKRGLFSHSLSPASLIFLPSRRPALSFLPTPPHLLCPPTYLLRTALQKGRPVQYFRRSKSPLRALMKENHRLLLVYIANFHKRAAVF